MVSISENTVIQFSVQRMVCTGCGVEANASCNCGVAYTPKKLRAAEAIKANPQKSNRAIAEETGISEPTVRRARAGASCDAPEEREGRDGKSYSVRPDPPPPRRGKEAVRERVLEALVMLSGLPPAEEVAGYFDGVDAAILISERLSVASKWLSTFNNKWTSHA